MFEQKTAGSQWERQTIQKVLLEHIEEQRRARRWSVFFKLIFIGIVLYFSYNYYNQDMSQNAITTQAHTALIDLDGAIGAAEEANADNLRDSLKSAFENKQVKGVILRINSPGGSPVQARQVYDEIRALRKQYPETKIYTAIQDLGASAAYLIASATDSIYSDKVSLVGSIGAKIDSFGFVDIMQKVGVERRLYTAGSEKGILDPYSPRTETDDAFINNLLAITHSAFIENVRVGRGARLKETPTIFSGLVWTGEQALALGLIDGYGDAQYIAKEIIKAEHLVNYSPTVNVVDRIANRIGASMSQQIGTLFGIRLNGAL